jgi:hypothetical protein
MKIKNIQLLFIFAIFFLILPNAIAQGGPPPPGDPPPTPVPINNSCTLLLVSGFLLALYKIRPLKNTPPQKNTQEVLEKRFDITVNIINKEPKL